MDQPPQQSPINPEGILATIIGALVTLGGIAVRGRLRVKGMREKIEAESRPQLETEYLKSSREITDDWKEEVVALRAQVDKVRNDYETRINGWIERALKAESQIPELRAEITMLKARVAELERKGHASEDGT